MYPYKYKISIRIEHPSIDLTKISQQIGESFPNLKLGRIHTAGEERVAKDGRKLGSSYEKSFFSFKFSDDVRDSQTQSLDEAIAETLVKLELCRELFRDLVQKNASIIFFIGVFLDKNSGITLHPELIRKLSESNIEIQLDIYPPDTKEDL